MARAQKHIRFDWAMKRLLRNKSNFEILEGFLSELLKIDIKIQEILESEGNQKYEDNKYNRVDILVKNEKDELILVEIQNDSQSDYFHRMNYGQSKLLTDHIDLSQKYSEIKKIYSINIVYFDLGQGDDYVYVGKTDFKGLHNEDMLQLSENHKDSFFIKDVSDIFTTYYILKINLMMLQKTH
jgi:predicted transposase/invertase (TIGR01784 family)